MTLALPPPPAPAEAKKYRRKRQGTAHWLLSSRAVDISVAQVYAMTDREAIEFCVAARWGNWDTIGCAHCGTIADHYWRPKDKRWLCRACRKTFSVTSQTVFSKRKLRLQDLIAAILLWVNSAGGQAALELRRHTRTSYNSAFTLQHKLRESLVRGYNLGFLSGDVEVDGSHQSGRDSFKKRGKPQVTKKEKATADLQAMLEQKPHSNGARDFEFGWAMPKDRRILFTMRKRSGVRGDGAVASRVAIGLVESPPVVEGVLGDYVAIPESYLNTDSSPAYKAIGKRFRDHRAVEHSKHFSGPNGENNNQAEELNWRMDRHEQGTYLSIRPKYMLDYAVEVAFRSDTRRMPNSEQLKFALNLALNVGISQFWTGFSRGRHRSHELLHRQPQPAPASGPAKGRSPISSANGRPPR
jgi:transposase-like protein